MLRVLQKKAREKRGLKQLCVLYLPLVHEAGELLELDHSEPSIAVTA